MSNGTPNPDEVEVTGKDFISRPVVTEDGGLVINHSRIRDFLACQEFYHLNYEFQGGLTPKATELALSTGTAYHEGISYYYHHDRDVNNAVTTAWAKHDELRALATLMADEKPLWDNDHMILEILIRAYHLKYGHEPLQVLMPEASGNVALGKSKHRLVFRTDAVYQEYGTIGLLEFKTKGRTPSGLEVTRIHSDLQPTTYIYGVRAMTGLNVEGVKFRWAIKNPKFELAKLMLEEFTSRTPIDLKRFEDEAIWVCDAILELRKTGRWLHNWNQCTVFGECRMRRMCLHHRDPAVAGLYRPRTPDYVDAAKEAPVASEKAV